MALFSLFGRLSGLGAFARPLKTFSSQFHTLKRLEPHVLHVSVRRKIVSLPITKRNFVWIFKKSSKREIIAKDRPPENYQLIYRNGIDHYFVVFQYIAFFASATIAIIVVLRTGRWADFHTTNSIGVGVNEPRPQMGTNEILCAITGFLFSICVLYFYLSRTPMRIFYNPKKQKYIFIFYGTIPHQTSKQTISMGEIVPLPDKSLMPWSRGMFQHKSGRKLLLFENYFRHPADLYVMLGWQKDPDVEGYEKVGDRRK